MATAVTLQLLFKRFVTDGEENFQNEAQFAFSDNSVIETFVPKTLYELTKIEYTRGEGYSDVGVFMTYSPSIVFEVEKDTSSEDYIKLMIGRDNLDQLETEDVDGVNDEESLDYRVPTLTEYRVWALEQKARMSFTVLSDNLAAKYIEELMQKLA